MNKKISRRAHKSLKAPMFVLLAMILIVIGIIATFFSFFVADDLKKTNGVDNLSVTSSSNSSSSGQSSSDAPSSVPSEPPVSSAPVAPIDTTIVPESEAVDKSYFEDAIFIGDSISKGLKSYGVLPATNVIADQNVGLDQVASDKPVYFAVNGTKKTLFQSLKDSQVKKNKIYILLGSNGLPHYENQQHIEYYGKVLDRIKKEYPNATIYMQSVTPISKQAEADYKKRGKTFTNAKINDFNKLVLKLAKEKNVYYLNVHEALVNKDGYLASEYYSATGDGVHFLKVGHEAMYQYYKTHTVGAAKPADESQPTTSS